MNIFLIVVAGSLALAFLGIGSAKIAAVPSMRERAAHLGFSIAAYRWIGVLEAAAAIGLAVGFAVPVLGIAAVTGLLLLLVGAVISHLRNRDKVAEMVPALAFGAVGLVCLALYTVEATS